MTSIEHSILPPSSAARRVACPGSRALEARYPDEDSPEAREGEAAHWVAQQVLKEWLAPDTTFSIGETAPNGEIITQEMGDGAQLYGTCVYKALEDLPFERLRIEERTNITMIHADCWGTPDCWFYAENELHIFDYKFGHSFVEVFENWQLIEYAAGIIDSLKLKYPKNITFWIVQPRGYHEDGPVRSWSIPTNSLRPYFERLQRAENEAMQPEGQAFCTPSPECNYCTARHACDALRRTALSVMDFTRRNVLSELTAVELGTLLRYVKQALERLKAIDTGLSEQANGLLRRGGRVPFFKIEPTTGRQRWNRPAEEIALMGELLGFQLAKSVDVITPKQAQTLGLSTELLAQFSETPKGAGKLVSVDEKTTSKIFGGIER
jgi:hypothetical protein